MFAMFRKSLKSRVDTYSNTTECRMPLLIESILNRESARRYYARRPVGGVAHRLRGQARTCAHRQQLMSEAAGAVDAVIVTAAKLTKVELRGELYARDHDLPLDGNKPEVLDRLREFEQQHVEDHGKV